MTLLLRLSLVPSVVLAEHTCRGARRGGRDEVDAARWRDLLGGSWRPTAAPATLLRAAPSISKHCWLLLLLRGWVILLLDVGLLPRE